eukprot:3969440-Prymnesium_polylepis.1
MSSHQSFLALTDDADMPRQVVPMPASTLASETDHSHRQGKSAHAMLLFGILVFGVTFSCGIWVGNAAPDLTDFFSGITGQLKAWQPVAQLPPL